MSAFIKPRKKDRGKRFTFELKNIDEVVLIRHVPLPVPTTQTLHDTL